MGNSAHRSGTIVILHPPSSPWALLTLNQVLPQRQNQFVRELWSRSKTSGKPKQPSITRLRKSVCRFYSQILAKIASLAVCGRLEDLVRPNPVLQRSRLQPRSASPAFPNDQQHVEVRITSGGRGTPETRFRCDLFFLNPNPRRLLWGFCAVKRSTTDSIPRGIVQRGWSWPRIVSQVLG